MSTDGDVDNGIGKGVRILSLDSGGPGTYSQLLIVKEYMARLASAPGIEEADVYPADYFDLVGGVGFGGLVAILLGHLRMNVDETIEAVLDVASAIFPDDSHPNSDLEKNTRKLRGSIEDILQSRGIPPDRKMHKKGEESVTCKVALYAATTANLSHPIVLRTYKPRGSSLNPTIVEAICATMATPSHFSPIKIGPRGRQQTFVGGPLGAHNPTRELLKEANAIFGKEKLASQIISIGCGRSHLFSIWKYTDTKGGDGLIQGMEADCETVDKELSTRLCDIDAYLRLNVDRGMENLFMNEWHDLGLIEGHTSAYVEHPAISEIVESSLRRLQESAGTVSLGQINHPTLIKDVQNLGKHKEDLDRTFKSARDNEDSRLLDRLKPVDALSYQEDRRCMKDTRTLILDGIFTWAEDLFGKNHISSGPSCHNVFWLYGSPGLGKTSVANSLCRRLHKAGKLGASFFCRRDDPILRDPNRVLPTLIYKLAWMWSPYRKRVVQALHEDPNLNPDWMGCELLLKHLHLLQDHPPMPLVLVIDALDECGEPQTRRNLLKALLELFSCTGWLRFIVMSRPEHDLSSLFQKIGVVGHDLATDTQAYQDIRIFAKNRIASLVNQYHLPTNWPGDTRLEQIATRSGGLFIFVETLYRFLDDPDPELLLTQVLSGTLEEANAELHKLYSTAIESRIGHNREHFRLFIQAVVVVATHRALPDATVASLTGLEHRVISSWVDKLGSLLYRDTSQNGGIRVRHLSALEFLVGSTCPLEFQVDLKLANSELARCCLVKMVNALQFNICELETSYISNVDIPDLSDRVERRIPDALQYSCTHWSNHLCYDVDPVGTEISALLDGFFAGPQPLYWIEVLSLIHKVPAAITALRLLKACTKKFEGHHQLLVEDVLRFVLAFRTPISTSAPHIYISALPFMPTESNLWKHTGKSFPNLITVCKGRMRSWPKFVGVRQGHTGEVRSVTYSPDGRYVVSGSQDKTIRIWDAETGAAIGEPLKGHTKHVLSVAYSPDGRYIVSGGGDKTIRIWDAETGAAVGEPLRGHTGEVYDTQYSPDGRNIVSGGDRTVRIWDAETQTSVCTPLREPFGSVFCTEYSPDGRHIVFGCGNMVLIRDAKTRAAVGKPLKGHTGDVYNAEYSPDGRHIVSCATDRTIRIWDAETGAQVGQPLSGHTGSVYHAEYSPDGRYIASCATDQTVRIWDAETGVPVCEPLKGHTGLVYSVSYSPEGQHIVSGAGDQTIRTWDAVTGAAVGEPLEGHSACLYSLAYSPDNRHIVSCAGDQTIRIWDADTGAQVGESLRGHTEPAYSVAYSPNGRHIVSGGSDQTIRIWDADTGAAMCRPLTGHTGEVYSTRYSPDGWHIVSCSADQTVRIWDAESGTQVGEPLKGHAGWVISVVYSPDGRRIVSGESDGTIRVWDAETGAPVGEPLRGHNQRVNSVTYSPDGQRIVSGGTDGTIRIWDAETGTPVGEPLRGHNRWVNIVAYSPDGRNIASGGNDQMIRIWNAETGAPAGEPLKGHTGHVRSISYSPDGRVLASASGDLTIRICDAQTELENDDSAFLPQLKCLLDKHSSMTAFSVRRIPPELLDSDGWVCGAEGLLFWVPEDCRNGLTCSAIITIPDTGRQRRVRLDFTHFRYGTSWTDICVEAARGMERNSGSGF